MNTTATQAETHYHVFGCGCVKRLPAPTKKCPEHGRPFVTRQAVR